MNCLIEPLEGRRMMSTTAVAPLDISSASVNGQIVLTINNAANVQVTERIGATSKSVHITSENGLTDHGDWNADQIVINGTDGADVITLNDTDIKAFVNTFKGIDQIFLSGSLPEAVIATDDSATIILNTGPRVDLVSVSGTSVYDVSNGHDIVEVGLA
jgi:hypothetical protein